jgi:UDP-2,3-diacylglucosamine hydrolase
MRPALLISDLHLSAERPALVAAFAAFCAGPARAAGDLYILGDLFDAWIGDDQLREPLPAAVARDLAAVAASGVRVHLMRGNRDFMLGPAFAAAAGATLLPERIVVDLAGTPTLLSHGDELCVDDRDYQRWRARTRDPRSPRGCAARAAARRRRSRSRSWTSRRRRSRRRCARPASRG